MKLTINTKLRAALNACRATAFTLTAISTVIGGSFAYNLHALGNDLDGVAGTYTLTEVDGVKKLSDGTDTVDYTGINVNFQAQKGEPINGDMTLNVESGTHQVAFLGAGGASFDIASADAPVTLTINVNGSSDVTFGNYNTTDNTNSYRLFDWSNNTSTVNVYADCNINVNTTGTVSAAVLTIEANSSTDKRKFYGDQIINYTSGTVLAGTGDAGFATLSLAAGAKAAQIIGDINYTFGTVGAEDSALTFAGTIYAGIVNKGASGGKVTGNSIITMNSGTFTNVFGAGEGGSSHEGNVTINYNGGTVGGQISATAGASISGIATLNVGGALNSSKVAMDTFDVINTTSAAGNLTIDSAVTIGAGQTLSIGTGSAVTATNSLTLNGRLYLEGGSLTMNGGSLSFGSGVIIDLSAIGGTEGDLSYSVFTGGTSSSFADLGWANFAGLSGISQSTHSYTVSDTGSITFATAASWTVDGGTIPWGVGSESPSNPGDTFANGDNAIFGGTVLLLLDGEIEANTVTVKDGGTLSLYSSDPSLRTLKANSFVLGAGSSLLFGSNSLAAAPSVFSGGADADISFALGGNITADHDFSAYTGSLTVEGGTLVSASKERFANLAAVNLGSGAVLSVGEILSNADHNELNNVIGDNSTTISVAFVGFTGDGHSNHNGRLVLNSSFTGTIDVREGLINIGYGNLGGSKKIIIGNASGNNSGLYVNRNNSDIIGADLTVEVKDGTTGYLAQDNGTHTYGSTFVGAADTALRKIDANNLTVSGDMSGFFGKLEVAANTFTVTSSTATNIAGISIANNTTFAVGNGGQVSSPELVVESGTGTLSVLSGGTLSLTNGLTTAANTLSLNVNSGATLSLGNSAAASTGAINTNIAAGATINAMDATTNVLNDLYITGSGNVTLSASEANATVTIAGDISGTAGLAINGQTGQTFVLGGYNNYAGNTKIGANTKVQASSIGTGTIQFEDATSELSLSGVITINGKGPDSSASSTTLTNITFKTTASSRSRFEDVTIMNTDIQLGDLSRMTLGNAIIDEQSSITNNIATLILEDSTIKASQAGGSLALSGNTAETTDGIVSDIDLIYSLTSIDVATVEIEGSLTLVVDIAGLTDSTAFETALTAGAIGLELDNVARGAFTGYFGDVDITVMNGADQLFNGVALGVTTSSAGNVVFYIPEPSTATMSLLALAGLLARRRRKSAGC